MNCKQLALISGVLATAFGQIQNILTGSDCTGCDKQPETPAAPKKGKAAKPAPEPEPEDEDEDDTELTVETDDDDETDYGALRATMKELAAEKIESNKDAVKSAMVKLGVGKIKDVPNEKLEAFIAALKKIK